MGPDSVAARTAAWAGVLARASPQVKKARRLEEFIRNAGPASASRPAGSTAGMVLLARQSAGTRSGPAAEPARTNERAVSDRGQEASAPPEIDLRTVADRVYGLMQRDLVLGRERTGRPGG